MRIRLGCLLVLLFSSYCSFAQLQVSVFTGVSLGCAKTVVPPNSTIDVGALQVGLSAPEGLCLANTGTSAITLSAITVTGADFSQSGNVLPLVIQPNQEPPVVGFTFAPTAAGTRTGQISFTDDASGSPQTFMLSGEGFTDFGLNTLVAGDNTQTVTAGQIASYAMTLTGAAIPPGPTAFNGIVNLSCSNLPPGASCGFAPSSVPLQSGSEFLDVSLNVSTTAAAAASLHPPRVKLWYSLAAVFAVALAASGKRRKRFALLACLMVLGLAISCGGGSKSSSTPTPTGTFPFSVNATSSGITHSKTMVLVVK